MFSSLLHSIWIGMLTGLLSSAIYALMASGLTLTYGLMNIINVAQGILVILGAYLSYALEQHLHLDLFVGLVFTTPLHVCRGSAHRAHLPPPSQEEPRDTLHPGPLRGGPGDRGRAVAPLYDGLGASSRLVH